MSEWYTYTHTCKKKKKKNEINALGKKNKGNLYSYKGFHRIFKDQRQLEFWISQINKEENMKETAEDAAYMSWNAKGLKCALLLKEFKGAGSFGFNTRHEEETNYSWLEISQHGQRFIPSTGLSSEVKNTVVLLRASPPCNLLLSTTAGLSPQQSICTNLLSPQQDCVH